MKRKYIITALLVFLTLCLCVYAEEEAEKIVVNDTFENYELGAVPEGWEGPDSREIGCYFEVVQDPHDPDNKCLALYTKDTVESKFTRVFEPSGGLTTIECRAILADSKNKVHYMFWSKDFMQPMVYKHGFTVTTSVGSNAIPNFTLDHEKWYNLKFVIDFNDQKISFFIDDVEVYSKLNFYTPDQISIDSIIYRFFYGPSYVDDFKVTSVGEISKLYTKISSDKYDINGAVQEIWNVKRDTLVSDFMENIKFEDGAVVTLLDTDGKPFDDKYLKWGMKLIIESPNKKQHVEYVVKPRDWIMCKDTVKFIKDAVVFSVDRPYVITNSDRRLINNTDKTAKVFEKDACIYLPVRKLCEGFDINVSYNDALNEVSIGANMVLPIGKNGYIKNGEFIEKSEPSIFENDMVYVPLSWAEDLTGIKIVYNKNGLIILHESDFSTRSSVKQYIISEISSVMSFD